ncbi:MAG: preprotein translocase subunit SecE [Candidatus Amoebophilus sp. 36-38]|nr:MAG: preprotein translocase subunit SecE [Candidatus Amoebophilus sp. 36-38]
MKKIKAFIIDTVQEVRYKVTWPSYKSLQESSVLVLVASVIFAAVIGVVDLIIRNAMGWFYNMF